MMSSNGNIFRVTGPLCGEFSGPGEFPTQRPVTQSFDVFFDLRLNKRLSKQPWGWWFEAPSWSLWRHRNGGNGFAWRANHNPEYKQPYGISFLSSKSVAGIFAIICSRLYLNRPLSTAISLGKLAWSFFNQNYRLPLKQCSWQRWVWDQLYWYNNTISRALMSIAHIEAESRIHTHSWIYH